MKFAGEHQSVIWLPISFIPPSFPSFHNLSTNKDAVDIQFNYFKNQVGALPVDVSIQRERNQSILPFLLDLPAPVSLHSGAGTLFPPSVVGNTVAPLPWCRQTSTACVKEWTQGWES